jgi:hypothetical protein
MGFKWVGMGFKWLWLRGEWRVHAKKWVRSAKMAFSLLFTPGSGLGSPTLRQPSWLGTTAGTVLKTTISQEFKKSIGKFKDILPV